MCVTTLRLQKELPNNLSNILSQTARFRVRVNDTGPIFYYCGAPGYCVDWQMVGVINPVSFTESLQARHRLTCMV